MVDLNLGLAFLAGLLTILSPCVLPLAPVLVSGALSQHKFGPIALALGLASTFAFVGVAFASIGIAAGIDAETLRPVGAVLLLVAGAWLLIPSVQAAVSALLAPLTNWANDRTAHFEARGLVGQFALGGVLGVVWSPCVGPTLGAASALAAQGENIGVVLSTMLAFGVGAAFALTLLAYAAKAILLRNRGTLMAVGDGGKKVLGVALSLIGVLVLTGLDKMLEGVLVSLSPQWLTDLTTRF